MLRAERLLVLHGRWEGGGRGEIASDLLAVGKFTGKFEVIANTVAHL